MKEVLPLRKKSKGVKKEVVGVLMRDRLQQ